MGRVSVRCEVGRGLDGQVERRGGGLALALRGDEGVAAGAALDHVVAPGDLKVTGRHWRRRWRRGWRRRRGGLADALPVRGARASAAATKDVQGRRRGKELAAWRNVRACGRCVVGRGLDGQVKRRGGGLALALRNRVAWAAATAATAAMAATAAALVATAALEATAALAATAGRTCRCTGWTRSTSRCCCRHQRRRGSGSGTRTRRRRSLADGMGLCSM
eukprot:scaffold24320_cov56-Phaeocystis_antarctica.AAC.3